VRGTNTNTNAYGNHYTHAPAYSYTEAAPDSASSTDSVAM
jgi:hypothetical protein